MSIKLKKRTTKFNPISWGLTAQEKKNLAAVPKNSLNTFRLNKGTATDWWNFTFRVMLGVEIAKELYVQETVDQLQAILDKCIAVREQFFVTKEWVIDPETIEEVEDALEAVMQMHSENTRRTLLPFYYKTQTVMHELR
jgi:hypothetical protein